jgi:DNA-binding transcriptional ArsR family regulator
MRMLEYSLMYISGRIGKEVNMLPALEQEINELHSRLCAGLADPKRILILYALSEKSLNVSELTETLALPQPTVSRHLKMLRERGLVVSQRKGQSVYYDLADRRVIEALDLLRTVLADMLLSQANLARSFNQTIANPSQE